MAGLPRSSAAAGALPPPPGTRGSSGRGGAGPDAFLPPWRGGRAGFKGREPAVWSPGCREGAAVEPRPLSSTMGALLPSHPWVRRGVGAQPHPWYGSARPPLPFRTLVRGTRRCGTRGGRAAPLSHQPVPLL